jgi:hypothetical protein
LHFFGRWARLSDSKELARIHLFGREQQADVLWGSRVERAGTLFGKLRARLCPRNLTKSKLAIAETVRRFS